MLIRSFGLLMLTISAVTGVYSQAGFKPRNADEEHAWRLYNQYKDSKKKEVQIKANIKQTSGDIKTMGVGSIPIYVDPADVAKLTRLRGQLKTEQDRQKNLETAWGKKFIGRYGDLKESANTIYDPTTKKNMDKIQFRLTYFPFYVHDGTYAGTISGAPGTITLIVSGTQVKGSVKGVYKYKVGNLPMAEPFSGSISGTLSDKGVITGQLSGSVGRAAFTGSIRGSISAGNAKGTWTSKALTTATGSFTARRR